MSGYSVKHTVKALNLSIRRRRNTDKHTTTPLELNRDQPDLIPQLDMSMPMTPITPPAAFLAPTTHHHRSSTKSSSSSSSSKGITGGGGGKVGKGGKGERMRKGEFTIYIIYVLYSHSIHSLLHVLCVVTYETYSFLEMDGTLKLIVTCAEVIHVGNNDGNSYVEPYTSVLGCDFTFGSVEPCLVR